MKISGVPFRTVARLCCFAMVLGSAGLIAGANAQELKLSRGDATVLVEPYASNIVRVSLSLRRDDALAGPGYGISAVASGTEWVAEKDKSGDVLRSSRMVVTVSPERRQVGADGDAGGYCEVLQWFYARCWALDQNIGGGFIGGDARVADVGAQSQGWQCGHSV